jgi:Domain of unknown function (DUF6430)
MAFRSMRLWRHWAAGVFGVFGGLAIIYGVAFALFPDLLPHDRVPFAWGGIAAAIAIGTWRARPRTIERSFSSPNMTISVVAGDLFDQTDHLVIGMCSTFDIETGDIIDSRSIQGQFLNRTMGGDVARLDQKLSNALEAVRSIGIIDKPGKTVQYPVGTTVTIAEGDQRFFCVAYTEMNALNEARATVEGIFDSLESLWRAMSAYGNGRVASMAVIGGGQSRISQFLPARDSIRLTIMSFVFASRREKICDGLRIIVRPTDYVNLDAIELQDFLDSL